MKPGTITIKDPNILQGMLEKRFDPLLVEIICFVAATYGCTITESFRPQRHPNDLHGVDPVRAVDLRTWCYDTGQAETIKDDINKRWQYDPHRPEKHAAIIHNVGQGEHFHVQVHPRTIRRTE